MSISYDRSKHHLSPAYLSSDRWLESGLASFVSRFTTYNHHIVHLLLTFLLLPWERSMLTIYLSQKNIMSVLVPKKKSALISLNRTFGSSQYICCSNSTWNLWEVFFAPIMNVPSSLSSSLTTTTPVKVKNENLTRNGRRVCYSYYSVGEYINPHVW